METDIFRKITHLVSFLYFYEKSDEWNTRQSRQNNIGNKYLHEPIYFNITGVTFKLLEVCR